VEEIDRKIVSLLSRNGRMSFTELARQAGLSVSAVHQRVRQVEEEEQVSG
jgi:Lrp/AsnC family leucine-responsive transcriptional regulator